MIADLLLQHVEPSDVCTYLTSSGLDVLMKLFLASDCVEWTEGSFNSAGMRSRIRLFLGAEPSFELQDDSPAHWRNRVARILKVPTRGGPS